jgi:hypothetical protein
MSDDRIQAAESILDRSVGLQMSRAGQHLSGGAHHGDAVI